MDRFPKGTWVLVADTEKALFLENQTDGKDPYLKVVRKEEHENPPTHEQGTDKPGRYPDSGPNQRSAVDNADWHELEKDRFAHQLAELLYKYAHRGRFEKLVIVAGPDVIGRLRPELHKEVVDRIVAVIEKNLAGHPIDEIEKRLAEELKHHA